MNSAGPATVQTPPSVVSVDVNRDGQTTAGVAVDQAQRRLPAARRRAFLGTLIGAGSVVVVGAILGGVALAQAGKFRAERDAGAAHERLVDLAGNARALGFAADLLLGAGAVLVLSAVVLRFGSGGSQPATPAAQDAAFAVPEPGGGP